MNTITLYIVTNGTDIEASPDAETAMERWNQEIGFVENLRTFSINLQVPTPTEITLTLPDATPVLALA